MSGVSCLQTHPTLRLHGEVDGGWFPALKVRAVCVRYSLHCVVCDHAFHIAHPHNAEPPSIGETQPQASSNADLAAVQPLQLVK